MEETVLLRVGIDPDQIQGAIKGISESRKLMKELIDTNKELAKAEGNTSDAYIKNEAQIKKLNATISTNQRVLTANQKLIDSTSGSIVEMRERVKILNDQYINLSKTARNSEFGKKLQKEIKGSTDELKKLESELGNFQRDVGNYKGSFDGLAGSVQAGGIPLEDLTTKMTAFINPVTAAVAGVTALGSLYVSSAAGARDLESATDQLSNTFTVMGNSLAKLLGADGKGGGLLSRAAFEFNSRVFGTSSAVSGLIVANANQALKELELLDITSKRIAKEQLDFAEEQRRIRDDEAKTISERLEAARNVETFINARELELVNIQSQKIDQYKILLSQNEHNIELQKIIKQLEFEIADINEDSQGKRTEALNGINALLKEQDAILKKIRDSQREGVEKDIDLGGVGDPFANAKPIVGELSGEGLANALEQDANIRNDALEKQNDNEFFALEESRKQKEDYANAVIEFNRLINDSNLELAGNSIDALASLNEAAKGNANITKALRIAETTVSTYSAAQSAYASQLTLPTPDAPIRAGIAAAAAVISGLARVAAIAAVKVGGGSAAKQPTPARRILEDGGEINIGGNLHTQGGTDFVGSDGTKFKAEKNEKMFVVNRNSSSLLDALKTVNDYGVRNRKSIGRNYFADGGFVARNSANAVSGSLQSETLRQAINQFANIKVVARITDINRVQTDVNENLAIATL